MSTLAHAIRAGTPLDRWRRRCGLTSWAAAAELLGVGERTLYRHRLDDALPRWLGLLCAAVEAGLEPVED